MVGCGGAVVYQEARHRAAKQGLSCFVSGAPIQTKVVEQKCRRTVCEHITNVPPNIVVLLQALPLRHIHDSKQWAHIQSFPSWVGSQHTRFQRCPHCYVGQDVLFRNESHIFQPILVAEHRLSMAVSFIPQNVVVLSKCHRCSRYSLYQPLWWSQETVLI